MIIGKIYVLMKIRMAKSTETYLFQLVLVLIISNFPDLAQ